MGMGTNKDAKEKDAYNASFVAKGVRFTCTGTTCLPPLLPCLNLTPIQCNSSGSSCSPLACSLTRMLKNTASNVSL